MNRFDKEYEQRKAELAKLAGSEALALIDLAAKLDPATAGSTVKAKNAKTTAKAAGHLVNGILISTNGIED